MDFKFLMQITEIEKNLLKIILQDNKDAMTFMEYIIYITQIWDDMIDQDKLISSEMINKAFHVALIQIPQNKFYQQYSFYLLPIMNIAINDWLDANAYENSQKAEKMKIAYVLRESVSNILTACAFIVGGYEWMRKNSLIIREHIFDESYDDYLRRKEK